MAHDGSKISAKTPTRTLEMGKIQTRRTDAAHGLRGSTSQQAKSEGQRTAPDQYGTQTVSSILKQMKEQLTQKTERPFDPTKLILSRQVGKADLTVKTEELRAEMRAAAQAMKKSQLSAFEKVFLEFFMGQRTLGTLLKAGEKKFREKSLKEWKQFFEHLYAYAEGKQSNIDQVVEVIFRGISDQDARPATKQTANNSVMVCDLVTQRPRRNRVDKFVRLPIVSKAMKAFLVKLSPGDVIESQNIAEWYGTGALHFLALYYRPVRKGLLLEKGEPTAEQIARHAEAAARAREALLKSQIRSQPQASNEKQEKPKSEELYDQKALLDKLTR